MEVSFNGSAKFDQPKQALNELAFCHYPVTVQTADGDRVFDSFDEAKEYVLSLFASAAEPDNR